MKKILRKLWLFVKTYKLDFLIAAALWLSPAILAYINLEWREFALWWLAAIFGPIIPFWVVVPVTTFIIRWLRKKIVELILWIKAQLNKLRMANEMLAYYTEDELELIKNKGKAMRKIKLKELEEFKKQQNEKRIKTITKNWEEE